jgi:hypothetical protein
MSAAKTPPQRHWRRYGTDPLPSPAEALQQPLAAIDDVQYLGDRGFSGQRRVAFGFAFGKLTLQIGYQQLEIG